MTERMTRVSKVVVGTPVRTVVQSGVTLDGLQDVVATNVAEGYILTYDSATRDWIANPQISAETIRTYFSAAGDLSYNESSGVFSFDVESVYTQANFDSDFNTSLDAAAIDGVGLKYNTATNALSIDSAELAAYFTTDNLPEGTTNLYYTTARADSDARHAISATGDVSYDPATGIISLDVEQVYTQANFDSDFNVSLDAAAIGGVGLTYNSTTNTLSIDSAELAAYFTTDNITEGSNLYYTTARFDSDFSDNTTDQLSEGSTNLYYTTARFDSDFSDNTTDQLSEGSTNLYYTTARADSDARHAISAAGDVSYDPNTGVISLDVEQVYTKANFDSDFNVALDEASLGGNGLTYNSTTNTLSIDSAADIVVENMTVQDNLVVGGNLQVNGTTVTVNSTTLEVTDNIIYMNAGESDGSPTQFVDVGWVANVNDTGSYEHVGMIRDATDGTFLLFQGYIPEPDSDVQLDTAHPSFAYAPLRVSTITGVYTGFDSDFSLKSTSDLSEGTNLYYTTARFDSDFGDNTTDNLSEGSTNLYYTTARFDSDFGDNTTDNLSEGSTNLYYTRARFDSDFGDNTTDDLSEGSTNLYYTTARFDSDFGDNTTDNLSEGSTNLYYTRARFDSNLSDAASILTIRSFFSAAGDLSYDANSGQFSFDVEQVYTKSNFDSDFNVALDEAALGGVGLSYNNTTNTLNIDSAEFNSNILGKILTAGEGIDLTVGASELTVNAEIATTTNPGVASFDSQQFVVTAGNVALSVIDGGTF